MAGSTSPRTLTSSHTVHIDRDPDDVFAFVAAVEQTPSWRTHLDRVEWLDEPPEPGEDLTGRHAVAVTTLAWYRKFEMRFRIAEHSLEGRVFAYEVVDMPGRIRNRYTVEPEDGGARFTMTGSADLETFYLRLAGPFLKWSLERQTRPQVQRLRELLEASG